MRKPGTSSLPESPATPLARGWILAWASPFLALTLLLASVTEDTARLQEITTRKQWVGNHLQVLRDRVQALAQTAFSPTASLATLVQVDGTISQDRFAQIIDRSKALMPYIRSVVAAPDDVARFVYPLAGNERVINLDYRTIPVQWAQIQQAKSRQAPAIFAPVKLVQGGLGIIQRNPIYIGNGPSQRYWGVVSVVLDLEQFLASAGIQEHAELDLTVFNPTAAPEQRVVWGISMAATDDAMQTSVTLPGTQWAIAARPRAGWIQATGWARETWVVLISGGLVSLLIGLLGYQTGLLRLRNQALVDARADAVATRDHLQALLDASVDVAIISTNLQGRVTVFNQGAQRMLGRRSTEAIGQTPALWHDGAEVAAVGRALTGPQEEPLGGFDVFVRLAHTPGQSARIWTFITADQRRLQVSLALSPVFDAGTQVSGYLGVAVDISAQRQAEAALRQLTEELEHRVQQRTAELNTTVAALEQAQDGLLRSEKLAALGALVAGVAHELNTPLGNCLMTASAWVHRTAEIAQELESGQIKRSSFSAYLHDAQEAGQLLMRGLSNAGELVRHFKQLSVDQTSEQRRVFTVESVIGDVLSLTTAQWKHTPYLIETDLQPLPPLDSYPGALGRVLSNLLQNALIHAFERRDSGTVRIRTFFLEPDAIRLEISDDGSGMDAQTQRCAFDPFYTTKMGQGGSGLGLNIVYNTVTGVLGGQIDLRSSPGAGTQFLIRIPLVAPTLGEGRTA